MIPSFRGFKGTRQVRGGTAIGMQMGHEEIYRKDPIRAHLMKQEMARQRAFTNSVNERKKKRIPT
eukprot:CAMPEP_0170513300 /NCGR_PEP_ID=MMETSP0208-20121228/67326_1 /TAXON_ID=197538 /ORGANISM="Strombidium inclinatum, Strain S3" /LENGTH=64 /DNA_ID=CAMNT_0010797023 /DNA_START=3251 /DNA_END=3445 /DNA_ORIENTATION=-